MNLATVLLDEPVDDRGTQPGPLGKRATEGMEIELLLVFVHAHAVVYEIELELVGPIVPRGADRERPALGHGFQRVRCQIPEDLLDAVRVDLAIHARTGVISQDPVPGLELTALPEQLHIVVQKANQIDPLRRELPRTREGQEVADSNNY